MPTLEITASTAVHQGPEATFAPPSAQPSEVPAPPRQLAHELSTALAERARGLSRELLHRTHRVQFEQDLTIYEMAVVEDGIGDGQVKIRSLRGGDYDESATLGVLDQLYFLSERYDKAVTGSRGRFAAIGQNLHTSATQSRVIAKQAEAEERLITSDTQITESDPVVTVDRSRIGQIQSRFSQLFGRFSSLYAVRASREGVEHPFPGEYLRTEIGEVKLAVAEVARGRRNWISVKFLLTNVDAHLARMDVAARSIRQGSKIDRSRLMELRRELETMLNFGESIIA